MDKIFQRIIFLLNPPNSKTNTEILVPQNIYIKSSDNSTNYQLYILRTVTMAVDEQTAAMLLWQVKAIATKEFESLPLYSKKNIFINDAYSVTSEDSSELDELSERRKRTVSIDSIDMLSYSTESPKSSFKTITIIDARFTDSPGSDSMEHHDWSKRVTSTSCDDSLVAPSLTSNPAVLITQKYGKRKRENFVGLSTKTGTVRATLRKKFSWKQYPEVRVIGSLLVLIGWTVSIETNPHCASSSFVNIAGGIPHFKPG